MCQRAAAAASCVAFSTATELGMASNMEMSFPASPKTTTSSTPIPSSFASARMPVALFHPARMTFVKPGCG